MLEKVLSFYVCMKCKVSYPKTSGSNKCTICNDSCITYEELLKARISQEHWGKLNDIVETKKPGTNDFIYALVDFQKDIRAPAVFYLDFINFLRAIGLESSRKNPLTVKEKSQSVTISNGDEIVRGPRLSGAAITAAVESSGIKLYTDDDIKSSTDLSSGIANLGHCPSQDKGVQSSGPYSDQDIELTLSLAKSGFCRWPLNDRSAVWVALFCKFVDKGYNSWDAAAKSLNISSSSINRILLGQGFGYNKDWVSTRVDGTGFELKLIKSLRAHKEILRK